MVSSCGRAALAALFLLPYVEMVITAGRPADQLRDGGYLPTHFDWSSFTGVWSETTLGQNLQVTLPLALPGVVTAVIFTFIAAWNEFIMGLTLTNSPDRQPLTVGIDNMIGAYSVQWNYVLAASVVAIVPVVILFAVIERHVVSGLTAGSVK